MAKWQRHSMTWTENWFSSDKYYSFSTQAPTGMSVNSIATLMRAKRMFRRKKHSNLLTLIQQEAPAYEAAKVEAEKAAAEKDAAAAANKESATKSPITDQTEASAKENAHSASHDESRNTQGLSDDKKMPQSFAVEANALKSQNESGMQQPIES